MLGAESSIIVRLTAQVEALPEGSVTAQVVSVVPGADSERSEVPHVPVRAPAQTSAPFAEAGREATQAPPSDDVRTTCELEHEADGAVVSTTVIVVSHAAVLPEPS